MKRQKIANYNYEVDASSRIYNITTGYEIIQVKNRDGYLTVRLWKDNKPIVKTVHRIVAIAFVDNPDNKPCVNHIDGVKQNNLVSNLEWVTYSENTKHSYENGLQKIRCGDELYNTIYSEDVIHKICIMMSQNNRNIDIAKALDVPSGLLKNIRQKKCWNHISDQYTLPSKSRTLSDATIHWICDKIQKGYRNIEILNMSTNQKLNKSLITKIRNHKLYQEITSQYSF